MRVHGFLCLFLLSFTSLAVEAQEISPSDLRAPLAEYFNNAQGQLFGYRKPAATQIVEAMGVPEGRGGRTTPLASGLFLVSGCRAHSCPDKSAVVTNLQQKIIRVGVLSLWDNECGNSDGRLVNCKDISLLIIKGDGSQAPEIEAIADAALLEWAKSWGGLSQVQYRDVGEK